jgi:hypothetical protein
MGVFPEQSHGLHDLPRLAVAALGDLFFDPSPFHRVIFGNPFYGGDLFSLGVPRGENTGPLGLAVHVDGAGAAQPDAAAEFGSAQLQVLPDHPEQGNIRGDIRFVLLSVDFQRDHESPPLFDDRRVLSGNPGFFFYLISLEEKGNQGRTVFFVKKGSILRLSLPPLSFRKEKGKGDEQNIRKTIHPLGGGQEEEVSSPTTWGAISRAR